MRALLGLREQHRQSTALFFAAFQQRLHRRPLGLARQRAPLQTRQGKQALHHTLHAQRLLRHHAQITCTLIVIQGKGLQRLHKPGQYRQGRADLVGDVRHKITPHGICLLQCRHIPREQQGAPVAIRMQMDRYAYGPGRGAQPPFQHHIG